MQITVRSHEREDPREERQVFNRRGYGSTTLDHNGRALGVTTAALYSYVQSKEEILFQCHQRSLDIGLEGIRQALSGSSAPDERLKIAIACYVRELGLGKVHDGSLDQGAGS